MLEFPQMCVDRRQKGEIEVRAFLVGRRPCRGIPVDYFLLVEERDALWEHYGIRVESGGERTEIPGITASQPIFWFSSFSMRSITSWSS